MKEQFGLTYFVSKDLEIYVTDGKTAAKADWIQ
jgi:hypothetical protein